MSVPARGHPLHNEKKLRACLANPLFFKTVLKIYCSTGKTLDIPNSGFDIYAPASLNLLLQAS